jgi:hypothetical protein
MVTESVELRGFVRGGSRGQGQSRRHAAKELNEEFQGRTPTPFKVTFTVLFVQSTLVR